MVVEPVCRLPLTYPIYALDRLQDGTLVVAGGGGKMKSGIPNACNAIDIDESTGQVSSVSSVPLLDAAVAITAHADAVHTVIGPGVKSYSFEAGQLRPVCKLDHDILVSMKQNQAAVAVSEDGRTMIIASDAGNIVSLQLPRYKVLFSSNLHSQGVTDLRISPDGSIGASTARDKAALLWAIRDGKLIQALQPVMPKSYNTHIRAIRFTKSSPNTLLTVESNPRKGAWVACWRRQDSCVDSPFSPSTSFKVSEDAITAFTLSDSGTLIAISTAEGHVSVIKWNGAAFALKWTTQVKKGMFGVAPPPHVLPVTGMRFSRNTKYLISASADYTIAVWPVQKAMKLPSVWSVLATFLTILVLCFAVLMADENQLHSSVLEARLTVEPVIAPYLDPHLTQARDFVRPVLTQWEKDIKSFVDEKILTSRKVGTDEPGLHAVGAEKGTASKGSVNDVSSSVDESPNEEGTEASSGSETNSSENLEAVDASANRKNQGARPTTVGEEKEPSPPTASASVRPLTRDERRRLRRERRIREEKLREDSKVEESAHDEIDAVESPIVSSATDQSPVTNIIAHGSDTKASPGGASISQDPAEQTESASPHVDSGDNNEPHRKEVEEGGFDSKGTAEEASRTETREELTSGPSAPASMDVASDASGSKITAGGNIESIVSLEPAGASKSPYDRVRDSDKKQPKEEEEELNTKAALRNAIQQEAEEESATVPDASASVDVASDDSSSRGDTARNETLFTNASDASAPTGNVSPSTDDSEESVDDAEAIISPEVGKETESEHPHSIDNRSDGKEEGEKEVERENVEMEGTSKNSTQMDEQADVETAPDDFSSIDVNLRDTSSEASTAAAAAAAAAAVEAVEGAESPYLNFDASDGTPHKKEEADREVLESESLGEKGARKENSVGRAQSPARQRTAWRLVELTNVCKIRA